MGGSRLLTELARAYESKLAVLEEARADYSKAVADVVGMVGPAMESAVKRVLEDAGGTWSIDAVVGPSGGNATLAGAPWSCITILDETAGTEFRIAAWVASSWGGPAGILRVAYSLQQVHSSLDLKAWISRCGEYISASAPGEIFDPLDWSKFPDSAPDWLAIRIASVDLVDRDFREAAKQAADVAEAYGASIPPLTEMIREAARPMLVAEGALLEHRSVLETRARHAGVTFGPVKGLGAWRGGRYLQVGQFWLATDPVNRQLVAACNKEDRAVVVALAERLGRSHANDQVAVLLEEGLRDTNLDVAGAVAETFELWFDTKASELSEHASE